MRGTLLCREVAPNSNGAHEAPPQQKICNALALKHARYRQRLLFNINSLEDNLLATVVTLLGYVVTNVGFLGLCVNR